MDENIRPETAKEISCRVTRTLLMYVRDKSNGGYAETERVKETQRLGAGRYIKKPFTLEKIGLAVRAELDQIDKQPLSIS